MEEIKDNSWLRWQRKLECLFNIDGHDWKKTATFFYPVNRYPYIDKLWEDYFICEHCRKKVEPRFFSKDWRVKNQIAVFSDNDIKLNLNPKEASYYALTTRLISFLDKKQGL